MTIDATEALGHLPQGLRDELTTEFGKITRNFRESRWEAAELNGGKLCEIVYTIIAGYVNNGSYLDRAKKPRHFDQACAALANADPKFPDAARLTIPRVLVGLYDVRNRRGVGHVGGDVDASHMDAAFVLHTAQWLMAELVRLFHDTDAATASTAVEALVDRTTPVVWRVGEVRRLLDPSLSLRDGTLLLLYGAAEAITDRELMADLEQKRLGDYRRVLRKLHRSRFVEYDEVGGGGDDITPRHSRGRAGSTPWPWLRVSHHKWPSSRRVVSVQVPPRTLTITPRTALRERSRRPACVCPGCTWA